MGFLATCKSLTYEKKGTAQGKSIYLKTSAGAGQDRISELYHPPGISSAPTKEDSIIDAQIGSGKRVSIVSHNYRIEVEVIDGQTKIYSTNADGSEIKSLIFLDNDGNIELNGNDKTFVTFAELDTALQNMISLIMAHVHTSASPGSPTTTPTASISVDISVAETTTIKTGG